MRRFLAIALLSLLGCRALAAKQSIRLRFSIVQGFGYGIVTNRIVEAVNRMGLRWTGQENASI